ncbi:MAG TPA: aldolase/citrate lyase family protein [Clostridiales bacterium]|nr:aldolase/citrate lyase family protein [Clostridiales bacterium]
MNKKERQMLEILKELKDEYSVLAVKAEFEAEGSRTDELVQLNEIVFRAGMDLFIKIGGCEAVRDLDQCRLLGATGIMAPMIETPFAMTKFVHAAKKVYGDELKDVEWIINAETKTCRENFAEILKAGEGMLDTISVGRVDLSSSMGLCREEINGDAVYEAVSFFAEKAKAAGLIVGMGGGISFEAIPFIQKMAPLIDKFETRKIVFRTTDDEKRLKKSIIKAMEFEVLYLQNKCDFYGRMADEDKARMEMMWQRHKDASGLL